MQTDSQAMPGDQSSADYQKQRFYTLRFMWTAIASFEALGLPEGRLNELRGLYQSYAEGVLFEEHINSQQKRVDPGGQP